METCTRQQALADILSERERSVSWLAQRIGRSTSHLSRVLHGERPLTDTLALDIASALGIPPESLTGDRTCHA